MELQLYQVPRPMIKIVQSERAHSTGLKEVQCNQRPRHVIKTWQDKAQNDIIDIIYEIQSKIYQLPQKNDCAM